MSPSLNSILLTIDVYNFFSKIKYSYKIGTYQVYVTFIKLKIKTLSKFKYTVGTKLFVEMKHLPLYKDR